MDGSVDPIKRGHLALRLIETADPPSQSTLTVTAETDVESMSLAQLISLAESRGLDLSRPEATPPQLPE